MYYNTKGKGDAKCEKHRTISLKSVIIDRLRGRTLSELSEVQYGLTPPDRGTRNAIFGLSRLVERMIENQKDVYVCFIDFIATRLTR